MSTHQPSTSEARRRKTVLFCPDCDHESGVAGDWNVRGTDRRAYDCPVCGTTITKRRRAPPRLAP